MKWLTGLVVLGVAACSSAEPNASGGAGTAGKGNVAGNSAGGSSGNQPAGGTQAGEDGDDDGGSTSNGGGGKSNQGGTRAGGGAGGKPSGTGGAVTAPDTKWVNVTSNLPELAGDSAGEVSVLSAEPGTKRVIAGLSQAGLFVTEDGGKSWKPLGTGAGSALIDHVPSAIVYDPEQAGVFWESGIYGDGVFHTTDDGLTFERLGDIAHNDSVSIDFADPQRKVLLAGPHETVGQLYKSTDGGMSWDDIGSSLPNDSSFSTFPLVLDSKTYLVGSAGYTGTWGIFRTTNAGQSWTKVSDEGPTGEPTIAQDGAIYWALANDAVVVSEDQGESWTRSAAGPVTPYSNGLCELPDGRIVALGDSHLVATADKGKTWKEVGEALPFPGGNCETYGFTYSAATKTFFINHNDCSGKLIPDTLWSSGFDYEKD